MISTFNRKNRYKNGKKSLQRGNALLCALTTWVGHFWFILNWFDCCLKLLHPLKLLLFFILSVHIVVFALYSSFLPLQCCFLFLSLPLICLNMLIAVFTLPPPLFCPLYYSFFLMLSPNCCCPYGVDPFDDDYFFHPLCQFFHNC